MGFLIFSLDRQRGCEPAGRVRGCTYLKICWLQLRPLLPAAGFLPASPQPCLALPGSSQACSSSHPRPLFGPETWCGAPALTLTRYVRTVFQLLFFSSVKQKSSVSEQRSRENLRAVRIRSQTLPLLFWSMALWFS